MTAWLELADLAIEATRNVFGVEAVITPAATGIAETLTVIHDSSHTELTFAEHLQSASRPMIDIRLNDLTVTPLQGDVVVVDGTGYAITDVQPDGQGAAKLFLAESV
jgi:hypothetical protein